MIEVMREAQIPADAKTVWAIVSDPDRAHEWFDLSDRTEVLSGKGLGQKRTQHGHWGRRASEVDQEIIAWEPGTLLAWKDLAERLAGKPAPKFASATEFRIELSEEDGATTVRLRSLQEPSGAIKGWLMKHLGAKDIERSLDRSLENLTDLVES
jgi:uncharacterized protein YndB with AHSA1/START domain